MSSRPKRLFITADAVGGVWQYTTELARAAVPLGYDTTLAVLGPPPSRAQAAQAQEIAGLNLIATGLMPEWLAAGRGEIEDAALHIAGLADQCGADVVQLNTPALGIGVFAAPVVAVMHSCVASWWDVVRGGDRPADFHWRTALTAEGLARAGRILAPSAAFAQVVRTTYGLSATPCVVHNGRGPALVRPRAMHDFAFTAGRLWDPAKDVPLLDKAAARLGIPFLAAGPVAGPHGERVRLQHLRLLGQLGDGALAGHLAARPVFVSAARYEPFGLAVLEAANAGCPLVLSDIPTFRELWDGVATFVDLDDASGFAAAIEDVIGDAHARIVNGERARERAGQYTATKMASAMASHYAALIDPAGMPAARVAA